MWHHFCDDGSRWHKRLGLRFPVAEKGKHVLRVKVAKKMLTTTPKSRHRVGITVFKRRSNAALKKLVQIVAFF